MNKNQALLAASEHCSKRFRDPEGTMVPKVLEHWKMVTSKVMHCRGTKLTSTMMNRLCVVGRCSITGDYEYFESIAR